MATLAGQMSNAAQPNPQWVACDGKYYYGYAPLPNPARPHAGVSTGTYRDYERNVSGFARTRGIGGWLIGVPYDAGATYKVSLADDSGEAALVANITTTTTASVASGLTVIPVTSATGFVVGLPIAATGIPAGATIAVINGLNITINPATSGTVASGATVTVTPAGPPNVMKPPAGVK